jgi:hypothetical protein
MSSTVTLESRLQAVEKVVADLQERILHVPGGRPWYEAIVGSMKDYPEFEEVVRFGRELREADRETSEPAE